ncbi:hypothetical protein AA313_de0206053 [Arthrobotrys entomopaga]|nr:hypothetical protein AA313_de0206053 [Arthrobotrys entomopaga]
MIPLAAAHRRTAARCLSNSLSNRTASARNTTKLAFEFYKKPYSTHSRPSIGFKSTISRTRISSISFLHTYRRFPSTSMASTSSNNPISDTMASLSVSETSSEDNGKRAYQPRYIDVGINLTDKMFQGFYNGRKAHESDLENVIQRAQAVGCKMLMVTGSDYQNSLDAVSMAETYPGLIFGTVGVHPCSASALIKSAGGIANLPSVLKPVEELALQGKSKGTVTAFGELGLDYDRFHYSDKESQLVVFEQQLEIAKRVDLPLFLHSRAAEEDFNRLLFAAELPRKGLVHSFTGTVEEMKILVNAGYDIGINGCSLKTEENLAVVKELPLERLQIETDGPWCEIRGTHASAKYLRTMPAYLTDVVPGDVKKDRFKVGMRVKGRNEPCAIAGVAWVISQVKGCSFKEVCETSWKNSMKMFRFDEAALLQAKWKESNPNAETAEVGEQA